VIGRRALGLAALGLPAGTTAAAALQAPSRVVTVGDAITEAVFAVGEGARVVAVDSTSRFPAPVRALPQVGYMRALATGGLLSLSPDLRLLSDGAGPPHAVAVLGAARLPITVIPDGAGPEAPPPDAHRRDAAVLGVVRLPRVFLSRRLSVPGLGVAGAALQGLFRNPLADPGLIGVSTGAALAAVAAIVFAGSVFGASAGVPGLWLLPAASFAGGLGATLLTARLGSACRRRLSGQSTAG
jgi:ABC-type Fe3+-siderophore transport system permease subunit